MTTFGQNESRFSFHGAPANMDKQALIESLKQEVANLKADNEKLRTQLQHRTVSLTTEPK